MKMNTTTKSLLFGVVALMLARSAPAMPMAGDGGTTSYRARGVVERIVPGRNQATINTEAIPGYMMAMTMDYPVRNTNELNAIAPGDKVTFTLMVTKTNDWIENVRCVGHSSVAPQASMSMKMSGSGMMLPPELKDGDMLPAGTLVAETGERIHLSDFRGKALAFTFFFTRCPLPNYCPLMSRNFAATRKILFSEANAPTNWELLSISFDPANDTPETLVRYAGYYRGDNSAHWLFAAATPKTLATLAPALDLMVVHHGATISHNLRTVVVDPRGRIYRQFDGNQWTPQQLADAVVDAAKQ